LRPKIRSGVRGFTSAWQTFAYLDVYNIGAFAWTSDDEINQAHRLIAIRATAAPSMKSHNLFESWQRMSDAPASLQAQGRVQVWVRKRRGDCRLTTRQAMVRWLTRAADVMFHMQWPRAGVLASGHKAHRSARDIADVAFDH
jgi:hypothetical protein